MKNKIAIQLVLLVAFSSLVVALSPIGTSYLPTEGFNASIIGEWVSEEDTKWKRVFTSDGKCKDYYSGVLKNTYNYSISNTSPQCGKDVHVDRLTSFLELTTMTNSRKICYEINGITEQKLSIRALGRGGAIMFDRN